MKSNAAPNFVTDYSYFGKVKVSGSDRVAVLHNILTQDIKNLPLGGHCPAALLTHTGKILLYMEVCSFEDYLVLVIENEPASKAISLIDKFIITEDVSLEDVTESYAFFQSYGLKPEKFLIPKNQSLDFLKQNTFQIAERKESEALRIEAGIPLYGIDMDENTILSETGLDKIAVSGTKGCYPGQEVIARIETYKGLTKKLCGLSLEGAVQPNDKIYTADGSKGIGWITSATHNSQLKKYYALGYLLKGYFQETQKVSAIAEGKTVLGNTSPIL